MRKILFLFLLTPLCIIAQPNTKGYYKDIFVDGGLSLSSRADLPAARTLGLSLEVFMSAKKTKDNTYLDTLLQNNCFGGNEMDENGVLLYPDGEPRFRMVYLHGGGAGRHGKSLGVKGRENFRTFVKNGGSFVGSCAGSFITSLGIRDDSLKLRPEYLGIWPGYSRNTRISDNYTGLLIDKKSPLLRFADFGGDRFVDSVYHNNGNLADIHEHWPEKTEILARYDTRGMKNLKREIQGEPAIWAYKENNYSGRVVPCGSHPENVKSGEKLDLMCAMVLYALEGNGDPTVKGALENNVPRKMDKRTHDQDPAHTGIGDLQYHHFTLQIPKGIDKVEISLKSLLGYEHFNLYLCAKNGEFAFLDNAEVRHVGLGIDKTMVVNRPHAGTLYISVYCASTVETQWTDHGTQYCGNLEVLNGVPYSIQATYYYK